MPTILVTNVTTAQELQLNLDVDSLSMQDNGSREAATSSFTLHDPELAIDITEEDELQISDIDPDTSTVLFGGFARSVGNEINGTGRIYSVTAYDYSTLLDRVDVIQVDRPEGESLHDRLGYFMSVFGEDLLDDAMTHVLDVADLPAQKFRLLSLRQAIEKSLAAAGLTLAYRVRADKKLEVWDTDDGNGTAPFNIRVGDPGDGEIAPEDLKLDGSSTDLRNVYWVRGATAAGSGYRTSPSSIGRYGRREAYQDAPDSDLSWKADNVGFAALRDNEWPKQSGSFTAYSPNDGWRSRQRILITSPMHLKRDRTAFDEEPFDIASVTTRYLNGAGDRSYRVTFGTPKAKFTARHGREARRDSTGPGSGPGGFGGGGGYTPGGPGTDTGTGDCGDCDTTIGLGTAIEVQHFEDDVLVGTQMVHEWNEDHTEYNSATWVGGAFGWSGGNHDIGAGRTTLAYPPPYPPDTTPFNDYNSAGHAFLTHQAPVGAEYARMRVQMYARSDDTGAFALFEWRHGTYSGDYPTNDLAGFESYDTTLHSGSVMVTPWIDSDGPYNLVTADFYVPIDPDGKVRLVLRGYAPAVGTSGGTIGTASPHVGPTGVGWAGGEHDQYELSFYGPLGGEVGQHVTPTPVGTGDGTATTFVTPYKYRAGTLAAYVEGIGQVAAETDPATGTFDLVQAPPEGAIVSASFVIDDATQINAPIDAPTDRLLGPTIPALSDATPTDVASAAAAGTSDESSRADHAHEGVHSVRVSDGSPQLVGDVTWTAGTGITLVQSGNDITVNATGGGGGGGGGGWTTVSTNGVALETGRSFIWDADQLGLIYMDGGYISIESDGDNIDLIADVVVTVSGDGFVFPTLFSDPSDYDDGHTYFSSATKTLRLFSDSRWWNLERVADSGIATVPSGSTVVTVSPSLGYDPINGRPIVITPLNNPTNDPGWFWVDNVGFDSFDLHVRNDPGSGGAVFAWRVLS